MSEDTGERTRETDDGIDRRSYLQWAGVAGVGLGVGGLSSGALDVQSDRSADRSATDDARSSSPRRTRESDVLVGVETDREDKAATVEQYVPGRAEVVHENADLSYVTVKFPDEAADRARENFLSAVTKKDGIRYAERNTRLDLGYTPSDPQFSDQTAAKMVNADAAWDVTTGSSDVTIAILDQGVMYDHPDLDANMDGSVSNYGKDFVSDDSDPYPVDQTNEFHGTHVAGIAAAEIDNDEGVAGISQSAILSGRVADENHSATAADVADGVSWATNAGADIINLSLSGDANSVLKDAVEYAYRNGVLIVAAAGNTSGGVVQYPAAYDECVAVSALTPDGNLASFSSVGSEIELAAPGMAVVSTTTTDGYGMYSGTSMAAPVVSGVAALAKSKFSLSNDELRTHLKDTAVDVGLAAQEQGYGRVDAHQAVSTTSDVTVVDDFEDGDMDEWTVLSNGGSSSSWGVSTSQSYQGTYSAFIDHENVHLQSLPGDGLPNYPQAGDTFRCRVYIETNGDQTDVRWGVQDSNNCYFLRTDPERGDFDFWIVNGGSSDTVKEASPSIPQDEWLDVVVDWNTDGSMTMSLYDAEDNQLAQHSYDGNNSNDPNWSDGGIELAAWYGANDARAYFDYITIGSTSSSSEQSTIEDFEDSDLDEYAFDRGSSGASVVSSPTYSGSNALEIAGTNTETISTSGLPTYPSAGDTFSCWMRLDAGTENANFTYGVQDHDNRYYVKLNAEQDDWWLFKYENGSGTSFAGESGIGLSADTWYEVEVEWRTDGDHVLTLTDASGSVLSQVVGTDSTWTDGGIGFDAYLSSGETVYFDAVTKDTSGGGGQELSVVDDFEDGDLSEYANASSTEWSAQNSFAFDRSYAAGNASNAEAIYNNSHTYSRGDEFELRTYLGTANGVSTGLEHWFCTNADATKKYVHYVSAEENEQYLTYRNGIDQTVIDSANVDIPSDEWLRVKVSSDDKTLTAEVYDAGGTLLSSVSGTDENLTSGGYGFEDEWRKEGPAVYVDTIRG